MREGGVHHRGVATNRWSEGHTELVCLSMFRLRRRSGCVFLLESPSNAQHRHIDASRYSIETAAIVRVERPSPSPSPTDNAELSMENNIVEHDDDEPAIKRAP